MLENVELELDDVVRVNPVLCRLSNERVLRSSGPRVALDGVATRADEVVQLGELDDDGVIVVPVEGSLLEKLEAEAVKEWVPSVRQGQAY